jgi:hypothetical protein
MEIRLRFERVYGTSSQYGKKPRETPPGSPIILENYPQPGERATIYLGGPVEDLYRTYQIARAGGFTLVKRRVLQENLTEADERELLQKAQTAPLDHNLTHWDWYITIVIERTIEVPDSQCTPRWFSLEPALAIKLENEFLDYGLYQADFIVDHLGKHIPRHFFATRDVDDRVVFFAGNGPPFRMFQITGGTITAATSGPIDLCNVEQIRATLSNLQQQGELALDPLTPATLLNVVEKAKTSDSKGRALEELVCKLFLSIPGLRVMSRVRTATEEIDIGIFNDAAAGFLASEKALILAECKNWSGKCGRPEFSLLEKKS